MVKRWQLALPLGKCSSCHRALTGYPPGFYPRRQYQLDVVADVVAGVALGGRRLDRRGLGVDGAGRLELRGQHVQIQGDDVHDESDEVTAALAGLSNLLRESLRAYRRLVLDRLRREQQDGPF